MTTHESFEEESWEGEIQALLGSLPEIDPPDGFISQSIDHRPLFAGRIGLGLVVVAAGVVGACVAVGAFGPREVVPELASMSQQHEMSTIIASTTGPKILTSAAFHRHEDRHRPLLPRD